MRGTNVHGPARGRLCPAASERPLSCGSPTINAIRSKGVCLMKQNTLRALLAAGKPTTATRLLSSDPLFTEMAGASGNYDYIEFMAECASFSQDSLENIARAAELHGMGSLIKVDFQNRGYVAQRAIASGFQGVLFTDCRSAEEVRESIRLISPETPQDGGHFGFPLRRFIGFQPKVPQMDHAQRLREIVKAFMIEKKEALEDIEAICATPGVDMVQFGGSDFSLSSGRNAKDTEKERKEAERKIIEVALRHGVRPRCEIQTPEGAQYYIDLGVRDFCLGDNILYLMEKYAKDGGALRAIANTL
jgi:2,4-dihydroxyhept-2-ene-1,7-dioic acid aldolase